LYSIILLQSEATDEEANVTITFSSLPGSTSPLPVEDDFLSAFSGGGDSGGVDSGEYLTTVLENILSDSKKLTEIKATEKTTTPSSTSSASTLPIMNDSWREVGAALTLTCNFDNDWGSKLEEPCHSFAKCLAASKTVLECAWRACNFNDIVGCKTTEVRRSSPFNDSNSQTASSTNNNTKNTDELHGQDYYVCHETLDGYRHLMTSAAFWLEGVLILIVGLFGLAGNVLTIVVLRRLDSNATFNRLLMSLGEFEKTLYTVAAITFQVGETWHPFIRLTRFDTF